MKRISKGDVSMGVAAVSLFIALGGPAQAASLITGAGIKDNSVTSADIKNSSLTGTDVKSSSLTGGDIKSSSILSSDIKDGSLLSKDFALGQLPKGDTGAKGDKGDTGATGPEGPSRWLLVNRDGTIEAQSGGFRIANAYPALPSAGHGNVYIDSGDADLTDNGIVATIALENGYDLGGDPMINNGTQDAADVNPEFSGEISASKCSIPSVVTCAPNDVTPGGTGATTNTSRYFVVSPRNSDGSRTLATANNRKRFYVILSGPRTAVPLPLAP